MPNPAGISIFKQAAVLNRFARNRDPEGEQVPPDVTLVLVHAVNPYGFHNDRRVNEDNIDLNRNFLTPEQFEMAWSRDPNFAGYVDADSLFNPEYMSDYTFVNDLVTIRNLVTAGELPKIRNIRIVSLR
jgi:hypothetical protein